jgi:hypothetical protein
MALPPLTHHEIIRLVEPFAKRGCHVDLGATDRLARRIVFKPVGHVEDNPAIGPMREVLTLECNEGTTFRLIREVGAGDLQARLSVQGGDPGLLLRLIDAVAVSAHFVWGDGFVIARSFNLEETVAEPAEYMLLTLGEVRTSGLILRLRVSPGRGPPGDIDLVDQGSDPIQLPEDLLAVQGLAWARLRRSRGSWTSSLRLRGDGVERSRDAQARLEQVAVHLARSLSEPPARFHERWVIRRWVFYVFRLIPILASIGVVSGLVGLQAISWLGDAYLLALILIVPPLAFMTLLVMRDIPGVDKPPLPRRSGWSTWRGV